MNRETHTGSEDKEQIRRRLKEAFPSIGKRPDLRPLSHEEAVEMRSRLASLRPDDVPFYLGQILEDLLDTHTNRAGESEDAEAVVQHLNVMVEGTDLSTIRSKFGANVLKQTLQEEGHLRSALIEQFALLSREQAQAICGWLRFAKNWDDLKWYADEIEPALLYWSVRATTD